MYLFSLNLRYFVRCQGRQKPSRLHALAWRALKELVVGQQQIIKSYAEPIILCMPKNFSCNMQESGILSAPGGQTMTAAPSTGPAAG